MLTFRTKMELQDFLMTHEMVNSDYSPPLERKGSIWLIFEKGDRIKYDKMNYLYIGRILNRNKIPRDLACFYKLGHEIRCHTPPMKDDNFMKYYKLFKNKERKRLLELNNRASHETKRYISESVKASKEKNKKSREFRIRQEMMNLLGNQCCKCGKRYSLSFVHRDPKEKIASVSRMIKENRSRDAIYHEVLKCVLMCEECREKFFRKLYSKKE